MFYILAVVSLDMTEVILGMPWLIIYDPIMYWASRECIFNSRKISVDMISAEEFNIFSRDSQDRIFMVSVMDIQQIIAGEELPE